jgi:N-acetylmuramoyl-L-alanine amidase
MTIDAKGTLGAQWTPYVVQQGDYLDRLAFRFGTTAQLLWSNSLNADLAHRRPNPNTLLPGDVLFVPSAPPPALPLRVGTTNRFVATVPRVTMRLRLRGRGLAFANEPFELRGVEPPLGVRGTVGEDATAVFDVPVWLPEAELYFPGLDVSVRFSIGHLDPINEPSGVAQRLRNLGFLPHRTVTSSPERVREAVARFQSEAGLPATGDVDDATLAALAFAHAQ